MDTSYSGSSSGSSKSTRVPSSFTSTLPFTTSAVVTSTFPSSSTVKWIVVSTCLKPSGATVSSSVYSPAGTVISWLSFVESHSSTTFPSLSFTTMCAPSTSFPSISALLMDTSYSVSASSILTTSTPSPPMVTVPSSFTTNSMDSATSYPLGALVSVRVYVPGLSVTFFVSVPLVHEIVSKPSTSSLVIVSSAPGSSSVPLTATLEISTTGATYLFSNVLP